MSNVVCILIVVEIHLEVNIVYFNINILTEILNN